jgi:serine/threonine-protein kinase
LLEERIAAGGMAEVFRARRVGAVGFSKLVCIKRMHRHLSDDSVFVGLFLDEGRTGAKLRHRNIVAVDDLGQHEGQFFIAMEFVHGVDLAQIEARLSAVGERFPAPAAVYIAMEVLSALGAAHRAIDPDDGTPLRIVHRDVAPHNILVSYAGEVKLGDFGIARAASRAQVTSEGVVRGRFGYMPPEQLSGAAIDGRADLYALGVVLFEMLAGQRPFGGSMVDVTVEAIIVAQMTDQKRPLHELRPDLSEELCLVVDTLLAKDPDERFATAEAALAVLERARERTGGPQSLSLLMSRLYPTQASVGAVSSPAIAVPSSGPSRPPPSTSIPTNPASFVTDASQKRGSVLQVVADGSDPLGRPFATDPRAAPIEPALPSPQRARWPIVLLAASLSIASATALGIVAYSRARGGADAPVGDGPSVTALDASRGALPATRDDDADAALASHGESPTDARVIDPRANGRSVTATRINNVANAAGNAGTLRDAATQGARPEAEDAGRTSTPAVTRPDGRATIRVVVTPFGQVSIDNGPLTEEYQGGRDFAVSAGTHRIRVTGGVEETRTVEVAPGQTVVLRFHGE